MNNDEDEWFLCCCWVISRPNESQKKSKIDNLICGLFQSEIDFRGIYKPCGHSRGKGVCQKSILLHKPYFVKWSTKWRGLGRGRGRGGVQKVQKTVHMVYGRPHSKITNIVCTYTSSQTTNVLDHRTFYDKYFSKTHLH